MTRWFTALAPVVLVTSLAACAASQASAPGTPTPESTPTADVAPFHAIPADSVFVSGTADCGWTAGPGDGAGSGWVARCRPDMSDPRISGYETLDGFHFIVESVEPSGELDDVWVADDSSIRNAEASWSGTCQGTTVDVFSLFECHYVGERAYEGLEFHSYHLDQPEGPTRVLGWISGGG
jgi:hypothetical protein